MNNSSVWKIHIFACKRLYSSVNTRSVKLSIKPSSPLDSKVQIEDEKSSGSRISYGQVYRGKGEVDRYTFVEKRTLSVKIAHSRGTLKKKRSFGKTDCFCSLARLLLFFFLRVSLLSRESGDHRLVFSFKISLVGES